MGLGVVYVENLRSLPLDDPLARELAALINLAMAGLLAAALSLRFAYPAALMEGSAAWWWSTGPVSRARGLAATGAVAALPPLLLSTALFATASLGMGATAAGTTGRWLVPWLALWTSALGVILGPEPGTGGNWLDAALGLGGLSFLALAMGGVAWVVIATGPATLAAVITGLSGSWHPGVFLGRPALPAAILSVFTALLAWRRLRSAPRRPPGAGPPAGSAPA